MNGHATVTAAKREEDKTEYSAARKHSQPERNLVDRSTEKVDNIF